mgnify:CR=1 FL=1
MRKKILPIIITLLALCSTKAFATDYDLRFAGVRVTSSNASHITGSGISGSVSYSYSTNTLTLNGVDITVSVIDKFGIKSNIPGLKIQLTGSNSISTYSSDGIYSQADMTIQGTGTLNVTADQGNAINAEGNLTFSSCTVEARSNRDFGILGTSGKTLTVNGGSLTAVGGTNGYPVFGFGHLSMTGSSITYPANAHYDEFDRFLKYADGNSVFITLLNIYSIKACKALCKSILYSCKVLSKCVIKVSKACIYSVETVTETVIYTINLSFKTAEI